MRATWTVTLLGIAQVLESRGVKTPAGRSTWQTGGYLRSRVRVVLFRTIMPR
jgi:hypothetical protein